MKHPITRLKGKSFTWAFLLFGAMVLGPSIFKDQLHLSRSTSALLLGLAGMIPLIIQGATGYGLDSSWRAEFSRTEKPFLYWLLIVISVALSAFFWHVALSGQP